MLNLQIGDISAKVAGDSPNRFILLTDASHYINFKSSLTGFKFGWIFYAFASIIYQPTAKFQLIKGAFYV
jgi:hypothetical protein